MAHKLYRSGEGSRLEQPLQTVACHEDLSATDLVGRFLLKADETVWQDGPLTRRQFGKARFVIWMRLSKQEKDSTVLIHSLTDHRRILPIEKRKWRHSRCTSRLFAGDFTHSRVIRMY